MCGVDNPMPTTDADAPRSCDICRIAAYIRRTTTDRSNRHTYSWSCWHEPTAQWDDWRALVDKVATDWVVPRYDSAMRRTKLARSRVSF